MTPDRNVKMIDMNGHWILGALVGAAWFIAGLRVVRWAVRRAIPSNEASVDGTWQHDVRERVMTDGSRFQANVHYFISLGAIFLCFAIAAVFGAVPIWLGVLGFGMAVLSAASVEARVRYGTGRLADVGRVVRSWLRLSA